MPKATSNLSKLSSGEVSARHEQLLQEAEQSRDEIRADSPARRDFLHRFDGFVELLRQWREGRMLSHADTTWLNRAASTWQDTLIQLRVDRYVRGDIGLSATVQELDRRLLSEKEVREYLTSKADRIYVSRKMQLMKRPSSKDEQVGDWYRAEVCFALEVLEGRVDLASQIGRQLYPMLEGIWLDEVKRLKAFLKWEQDGEPEETEGGERRYYWACQQLSKRALEESGKATVDCFDDIANYLEQSYLTDGRVDTHHEPSAHRLIEDKAKRIWQSRPEPPRHQDEDWHASAAYVHAFYDHIIPAVQSKKKAAAPHVAEVCRALTQCNRVVPCDMVNCLEAAVVIYHLDAAQLRDACGNSPAGLF